MASRSVETAIGRPIRRSTGATRNRLDGVGLEEPADLHLAELRESDLAAIRSTVKRTNATQEQHMSTSTQIVTRVVILAALLSSLITVACRQADGPQDAAATVSKGGFILQPEEGEVLLMGGPPGGQVIIKVDPAKTGSPQMAMGIQYVEGEIPVHQHEHEEEFLFVHQGQGVGTLGDQRVPVQAGTTIYIPPGTWHGVQNTADGASQIMWVVTPGAGGMTQLEHFFRAVGAPPGTQVRSLTPEQFADIMEKHGMRASP